MKTSILQAGVGSPHVRALCLQLLTLWICIEPILAQGATPKSAVARHGALSVRGNRIVDQHGNPVVLRGMSLFWSQWMGGYYNSNVVQWLQNDWGCSVVRVAMGVESGGYLANPEREVKRARMVIDAAVAAGMYVILDWHDHNAHQHLDAAKEFFRLMAKNYGAVPNLIYETWNEPLKTHSWKEIVKPYHQELIQTIRGEDPDNLILCGTPAWSQDVDVAARDPLQGKNLAYTLHFYAATHKQRLREKATAALASGAAIFVSEWGTCESTGGGFLDAAESRLWLDFMDQNQLSWCNWSLSDKKETASALVPGAAMQGGWGAESLTPSGKLLREELRSKAGMAGTTR